MTKTLLLLLILLLAGFLAFIPHIGYAYPLHVDEWMHLTYAKTIAQSGAISFPDPFTGEGTVGPGTNVWLGYHVLMAMIQKVSGIDWLVLWRFGPSVIFMLTMLCVYIFANKGGYGLEAAFFTCLLPTTVGLLGPAFMVPMALGLLFIPLSLYIAFYIKSWASYLLLFLITCFLWSMHPTTAAIQGIVLLPFVLISLKDSRGRSLGLLAAVLLPILITLPFTINQLLPAASQLFTPKAVFPPPYVDIPAVLKIYGFIPLIFCFIGIILMLKRGGRSNYALLLALVLLLVVMLAFARFQVGMDTIFERGITTALLLIGIIAGAGLYWLRMQVVTTRILEKYMPRFAVYSGGVLCALSVVVILALAIPARFNVPYYHMIDDDDYRAFVWIRDNIGPEYEIALLDPWKATAFAAVTGKYVVSRIWVKSEPADEAIYGILNTGCIDTAFLRDNQVSLIYNRLKCNNNDLIEIRNNVFITNAPIAEGPPHGELLNNAGFESVINAPPVYWNQWHNYCKPEFFIGEPGRDGGSCAAIHILAIDPLQPWPWASYSQKVPVEGGRSYRIGGWVRTADVTGRGGACMRMEWRDPNNNICSIESMTFLRGTNNWVYYDKKVVAPPDSVAGTIVCSMIDCLGTAWYDDVSFKVE